MAEEVFYDASAECANCGKTSDIQIPKGVTVQDFSRSERGKETGELR